MSNKLKDNNYYVVHGWMINQLGLKGTALYIYAIIYGFSQAEDQEYTGSINYLCEWLGGSSRTTVINTLKSLVEKGLIHKESTTTNGVIFNRYIAVVPDCVGSTENVQEGYKNCTGGSTKTVPNNITNISKDKKKKLNEFNALSNEREAPPQRNNNKSTKGLDINIVKRQVCKICKDLGEHDEADICFSIIDYYFSEFENVLGEEHTRLSNKAMTGVIQAILGGTDKVSLDLDEYRAMIDKHFTVKYGKNIDYNICHFMTDKIRDHRYHETVNFVDAQRVF